MTSPDTKQNIIDIVKYYGSEKFKGGFPRLRPDVIDKVHYFFADLSPYAENEASALISRVGEKNTFLTSEDINVAIADLNGKKKAGEITDSESALLTLWNVGEKILSFRHDCIKIWSYLRNEYLKREAAETAERERLAKKKGGRDNNGSRKSIRRGKSIRRRKSIRRQIKPLRV